MAQAKLHDEEVKSSIRWIFRQKEARPFLEFLQSELEAIGSPDTCALQVQHGRRTFASELITAGMKGLGSDGPETDNERYRRNKPQPEQRKSRRHGPAGR